MQHALILALLLFFQGGSSHYGKTDAQILKMGSAAWYKFYTSRAGESTADMAEANNIYAQTARKRNDRLIKRLPKSKRRSIVGLRDALVSLAENAITLASNRSGGGTIWIPLYAERQTEVEELIYTALKKGPTEGEAPSVSTLNASLTEVRQKIEAEHKDKDAAYFDYPDALSKLKLMRSSLDAALKISSKLNARIYGEIRYFCNTAITTANEPLG